jgi:FkbM family methyltransferase
VLPFNLAEMEMHIYGQGETFVHPGDVVLDCGASDGDFTREALRAGAAKVVSIEIAPSSAECIRRNLETEIAAGKVVVYPKGVWDKDDRMTLDVDDTNFAANTVVLRPRNAHPAVEVTLTTIDKLVAELGLPRVDFIKMDIEGAEVRAVRGARKTIARDHPRMALSAYHRPSDPVELPKAVHAAWGGYTMLCGPCAAVGWRVRPDVLLFY